MFEIFDKYLLELADITEDELAAIHASANVKNFRKWQSLLHDGEVLQNMCFITSGCFRLFRYDKSGNDHTVRFGVENWWMNEPESFNNGTQSKYNIEALSASTVIIWHKDDLLKLQAAIPAFKHFFECLNSRALEAAHERIFNLISASAEERYVQFQKTYPKVFNSVPLHMVASYLGVSRETLSRIRRDYLHK
ncbi:Crp/Fnr family transcriptional regulator [Pedobacter frigidisoli]|uniref:Crp/Fnr family transcriptional regulator n=1 Tax=Pedobacter frigidisoli TaxID=2530455 RepID=UPI00292E7C09|nr:Crp/Fnr family transcriptional regulator [Pedobacter frigidisoli]